MTAAVPTEHIVTSLAQLAAIYGEPQGGAVVKEIDHVNADYRAFIERAPFCVLATAGDGGLDCTPRGDPPGFVRAVLLTARRPDSAPCPQPLCRRRRLPISARLLCCARRATQLSPSRRDEKGLRAFTEMLRTMSGASSRCRHALAGRPREISVARSST